MRAGLPSQPCPALDRDVAGQGQEPRQRTHQTPSLRTRRGGGGHQPLLARRQSHPEAALPAAPQGSSAELADAGTSAAAIGVAVAILPGAVVVGPMDAVLHMAAVLQPLTTKHDQAWRKQSPCPRRVGSACAQSARARPTLLQHTSFPLSCLSKPSDQASTATALSQSREEVVLLCECHKAPTANLHGTWTSAWQRRPCRIAQSGHPGRQRPAVHL
mmetsp:Transcript_39232/g.77656  ORF Transcript_39232/g.77656 Transcript_39232/m.77656 type:complete len:216 (-) Transcript_39232:1002-1649(-)